VKISQIEGRASPTQATLGITVSNEGHRPVQIHDLDFIVAGGRHLTFPDMLVAPELPHSLQEGHSLKGSVVLDFAQAIVREELPSRLRIRGACRDGLGRVYRSWPRKVDLESLVKLVSDI